MLDASGPCRRRRRGGGSPSSVRPTQPPSVLVRTDWSVRGSIERSFGSSFAVPFVRSVRSIRTLGDDGDAIIPDGRGCLWSVSSPRLAVGGRSGAANVRWRGSKNAPFTRLVCRAWRSSPGPSLCFFSVCFKSVVSEVFVVVVVGVRSFARARQVRSGARGGRHVRSCAAATRAVARSFVRRR